MGLVLSSGLSAEQRGNELAEPGINLDTFSCRYFFQFKDYLNNFQGQIKGHATPDKFSREVTITGEAAGSTGIMATILTVAQTFANDVSTFVAVSSGSNAGGFYGDEITESQGRDGFRRIDAKWTSHPLQA